MCRWLRIVSVIVAASVSSATATAAPVAVTLCVDDTRNVRTRAARELQRWPSHVRIALSADPHCRSSAGHPYIGWFERRGRRVYLAVRKGSGGTLRRALPRLSQCDGCLARLAARGKLVELSVILQGLVLEHNLGLSSVDPAARPRQRAPGEHPPRQPQAPRTGGAAPSVEEALSGATGSDAIPAPVAVAPPTATEPPKDQGHGEPTTTAASQPVPAAVEQPDATERRSPTRALPVQSHEVDEPGMQVAVATPEGPRPSRTEASRPRASPPVVRRRTRRSGHWLRDFSAHTHVAGRWRSSDLWSLEVGGSLGWRSLILRVGYQLPAEWNLEGRPVEATAIPMLAGWRPALWKGPGWRLRALAGVAVERIALRRQDLPDASWHSFWDVGVTVGAAAVLNIGRGLHLGAAIEGTWFPAGQEVEVPDGPTARFNQLGLQAVVQFSFGGAH